MIIVWSAITLGSVLLVVVIAAMVHHIRRDGFDEEMFPFILIIIMLCGLMTLAVVFKGFSKRYVEKDDFEHHVFSDRIIVVTQGIMKEYSNMSDLKCFQEDFKIFVKTDYNILGYMVEEKILNSCEMEKEGNELKN